MSTLEHEVIKNFHRLDREAQERVREFIVHEIDERERTDTLAFDYDAWFREVEALRQEMFAVYGNNLPAIDVVGMLRDIRDGDDE